MIRTLKACLIAVALLCIFLHHAALAAASSTDIREMKRILWVLGLSVGEIDGTDSGPFRTSLSEFLISHNRKAANDEEAIALLKQEEDARNAKLRAPYELPHLLGAPAIFRRSGFKSFYSSSNLADHVRFSDELNEAFVGPCSDINKFDMTTGQPFAPIRGIGGSAGNPQAELRVSERQIICSAKWSEGRFGLIVKDIDTGANLDFVELPSRNISRIRTACTLDCGMVIAVSASEKEKFLTTWKFDLKTKSVAKLGTIKAEDPFLLGKFTVSSDGRWLYYQKDSKVFIADGVSGSVSYQFASKSTFPEATFSTDGRFLLFGSDGQYKVISTGDWTTIASKKIDGISDYGNFETPRLFFDRSGNSVSFFTSDFRPGRWNLLSNSVEYGSAIENFDGELVFDGRTGKAYAISEKGIQLVNLDKGAIEPGMVARATARFPVAAAAFDSANTVAALVGPGHLAVVDLTTGRLKFQAEIEIESPKSIVFLRDGRMAVGSEEGEILTFSAENGEAQGKIGTVEGEVETMVAAHAKDYLIAKSSHWKNDKHHAAISVFDTSSATPLATYRSTDYLRGFGFVDDETRLIYGDSKHAVVADLKKRKVLQSRELRTNITRTGSRTNWYWANIGWVLPQQPGAPDVLFSAVNIGQPSVIYSYRNGNFKVIKGRVNSPAVDYRTARYDFVAPFDENRMVGAFSSGAAEIADVSADKYFMKNDKTNGNILAMTTLGNHRFAIVDDKAQVYIYEEEKRGPRIKVLLFENSEWLSIADEGYFAGTTQAAQNLFVATDFNQSIPIDSFFDTLYRPDVVAALSSGQIALKEKKNEPEIDFKSVVGDGMPPSVTIVSPVSQSTSTSGEIKASASLKVGTGGVGRIEWRVNGIVKVARTLSGPEARPQNGELISIDDNLLLEPGKNEIALLAYNETNRLSSAPAKISVDWKTGEAEIAPRLFVLSIGINNYWDSRLSLKYASIDATTIAGGFADAGRDLYQDVKTWLLTDAMVTREQISATFDDIARSIRSNDVFVLFVAGHGKTENGRYFYLPYDLKYEGETSIVEQGIGQEDWQKWMSRVATRKSLMMFDTCESGTLTLEKLTRGFDKVAALDRLTRATGRSVLAASSDDGPALEGFQGHGVFAFSVLEALGAADATHSGLVKVTGLASYVGQRVPEISFGKFGIRQIPQMKLTGEDFAIAKVTSVLTDVDSQFIPVQATHVVIEHTMLKDADGRELGSAIEAGTLVRVLNDHGTMSDIAKEGRRLGFVDSASLVKMQ